MWNVWILFEASNNIAWCVVDEAMRVLSLQSKLISFLNVHTTRIIAFSFIFENVHSVYKEHTRKKNLFLAINLGQLWSHLAKQKMKKNGTRCSNSSSGAFGFSAHHTLARLSLILNIYVFLFSFLSFSGGWLMAFANWANVDDLYYKN